MPGILKPKIEKPHVVFVRSVDFYDNTNPFYEWIAKQISQQTNLSGVVRTVVLDLNKSQIVCEFLTTETRPVTVILDVNDDIPL